MPLPLASQSTFWNTPGPPRGTTPPFPTHLAWPLPRLCVCGGRGGSSQPRRLALGWHHICKDWAAHRGQCEWGLRGQQFRGRTRVEGQVHGLWLDGAVGVRALPRTLRSLCSHNRLIMGGSLARSDRCSFTNPSQGGPLPPVLCHRPSPSSCFSGVSCLSIKP